MDVLYIKIFIKRLTLYKVSLFVIREILTLKNNRKMLRIAIQAKGRLYEDTMELLTEAGIKLSSAKRTLLIPARNFPVEILFLRDDDIPCLLYTSPSPRD